MGETKKNEKESKISNFWNGLKGEFHKISWPEKESMIKQTFAVTIASLVLGILIALIDTIVQYGVNFLTM